jgi:hypothetical protein
MNRLRLQVVACRVFERELEHLAPGARTAVTLRYLDMGLHEGAAEPLHAALQEAIDAASAHAFDAVALAYGVCNRGIIGLRTNTLPVVIPRAHDCIGMLLGSSRRYLAQLESQPGTYFQSPGWVEHLPADRALHSQNLPSGTGSTLHRDELVARYGEDNADYLLEQYASYKRHYERLAFVRTPVSGAEPGERQAAEIAREQGWTFECLPGDLGWLQRLLDGDWSDQEFLQLQPGQRVRFKGGERLIDAESE